MGPKSKRKKPREPQIVSGVEGLAKKLEEYGEEHGSKDIKFSATRLREAMNEQWTEKGWKDAKNFYFPPKFRNEVEAMVEALHNAGYGITIPKLDLDVLRNAGATEEQLKPENLEIMVIMSGKRIDPSRQAQGPSLLDDIERNLLAQYFGYGDTELSLEGKMGVLEKYAARINRSSSDTSLKEFDLIYRGVQDAMQNDQKGAAALKGRFGALLELETEVKKKIDGEAANLPAPERIVPVREGEPPVEEARPKAATKPRTKYDKLKALLAQGEPASDAIAAARFKSIMEIYGTPVFRKWINAKYRALQSSLANASQQKDSDMSTKEREGRAREIAELEERVSVYQQSYAYLSKYAPDKESRARFKEEVEKLGLKNHEALQKYVASQTAMMNEVDKLRLSRNNEQPIYDHLSGTLKPGYSPKGQTLRLGSGSAAKKKAEALAKILRKYPQLTFSAATVRVSRYYDKGRESWAVEMGTAEECARRRALNAAGGGTNVPHAAADFRENLPRLYAERIGDADMNSRKYAKAYEQLNKMAEGGQQRYNIAFQNRVAAGEFYSMVWEYGAAHGFSVISDVNKRKGEWVVSVSCPKEETLAPTKAEAPLLSEDPLAELVVDPYGAPVPKGDATTEPVAGTSDLGLSRAAIEWMNRSRMSPAKFQRLYAEAAEKYNKLSSGTLDLEGWNTLLGYAQACEDLSEVHLAALEANKERFREERPREFKSYRAYVRNVRKLHKKNLEDLEAVQSKIHYLESASPEKVRAIPQAIDGRNTYLTREQRVAAVSAYKRPGASWSFDFEEPRHAKRVYEWLLLTNFDSERVALSGRTLKINGPEPVEETELPAEGGEMVFNTAVEIEAQNQKMLESIYAWADPEAARFLQSSSRTTSSGKTHQQILESFVAQINEEQLESTFSYLNFETYRLSHGMPPSGEHFELIVSNTADTNAVMEGIRLLYIAAGLDTPYFHNASVNLSAGGSQQIRVRGLPQAYTPPLKDFSLPEPEEGYVSLPRGEHVYLSMEQKRQIEAALTKGEAANITIYKDAKERQVDTAGAYALMDYLRSRGWSNVGVAAWKESEKKVARAAVAIYAVPPGYWERPSVLSAIEGRNVMLDAELLREKVEERSRTEMDSLMVSSEGGTPTFSIPENGVMNIGSLKISILDKVEEEIAAAKAQGGRGAANLRKHLGMEEQRIARQKKEIEGVVNTPGAAMRITFHNFSIATEASKVIQSWLRSQADMRIVTVEKGAVFRKIPYTRNYYLVIKNPSGNAFGDRFENPMYVPASYRYTASSGKKVQAPLLASTMDRVRLDEFLKGHGGENADFYMRVESEEVLRAYLSDSGFNMDNMETTLLKGASEIPIEFRKSAGAELESLLSETLTSGKVKYVRVRLTIPEEEALPAEINEDSNRARYAELATRLYGRGDDEALRNYYGRHPKRVETLLSYARNPSLLKEDWTIRFSRADGGESAAERMYFVLDASGMFPGVAVSDNKLMIRALPEEAEGPRGRRGYHKARMKHANEVVSSLLGAMLPAAQQESKAFTESLLKSGEEEQEVVFAMGNERISTTQAYQNRLSAGDANPLSLFYGLFSDAAQQSIFNMFTSENKTNYAIELFNLDMKLSEVKKQRFDPGPSIAIMQGFLGMHAGFGMNTDWATRHPKYARRAREMYEVLSAYGSFGDFAKAIGTTDEGIGAATAIYQYANIMTNLAVSNNTSYATWGAAKQKAYKKAVSEVMWRALAANFLFETGPVLGFALPKEKKEMYGEYRNLLVEYFSAMGENSKFTHNGKSYYVLQSLLVRNVTGENLLCVPTKAGGPNTVLAVMGRRQRKTKAGNFVWELTEKVKAPGAAGKEGKMVDQRLLRLNQYFSLGGLGVTGAHSGDLNPLEGFKKVIERTPKPVPEITTDFTVPTTIGNALMPIVPLVYAQPLVGRYPSEVVWKYSKRRSPLAMAMLVPKEVLFENVKDPRLGTISTDLVEVTLKGGQKKTVTFILPPRHRYNEKREREEDFDYPANLFKGMYASAYVWNNSVYVIDYINPKDAPEDPLEQVPQNARRLYNATNEELKQKGLMRINIGRFDSGTGIISFRKEEHEKYAKHLFGQILLSPDMLKEMGNEELDKFFETNSGTRYPAFHYYSFVPPKEGESDTGASEEVVGGSRSNLYLIKNQVIEGVGGNIPPSVVVEEGKEKMVLHERKR